MIVKYVTNAGTQTWGFIDKVKHVTRHRLHASHVPQALSDTETPESEQFFVNAVNYLIDEPRNPFERPKDAFAINAVIEGDKAAIGLIMDMENGEKSVLVTNQNCFLLNDNGKTIERVI